MDDPVVNRLSRDLLMITPQFCDKFTLTQPYMLHTMFESKDCQFAVVSRKTADLGAGRGQELCTSYWVLGPCGGGQAPSSRP